MVSNSLRERFDAELASLVDRTADAALVEQVASDDQLRDDLHAARELVTLIAHAADDYVATAHTSDAATELTAPVQTAADDAAVTPGLESVPAPRVVDNAVVTPGVENVPAPRAESSDPSRSAGEAPAAPGASALPAWRNHGAAWAVLAAAAVMAIAAYWLGRASTDPGLGTRPTGPQRGSIAELDTLAGGLVELCKRGGSSCRAVRRNEAVASGMTLRTNSSARVVVALENGSSIALERATNIEWPSDADATGIRLQRGTIVVDAKAHDTASLVIDLGTRRARAHDAKCSMTRDEQSASIEVIRGRVELEAAHGRADMVRAGETATLIGTGAPLIGKLSSIGQALVAADSIGATPDEFERSRGLGEMRAKKPGEAQERSDAVRLARHHARVRIAGPMARTEIEEVFSNDSDDVLEGIFRFPLPAGAQIERLALEVDGNLVEGAFTDRERASAIWRGSIVNAAPQLKSQIKDEIIWVPGPWRDPALLEWQRGNRFELRIYPIPKHGSRRVILAYTELVPAAMGTRNYSYPLPERRHGVIDEFSIDVQVRGYDATRPPRVMGYAGEVRPTGEVSSFSLAERHFAPHGDLLVSYELSSGAKALTAWAHRPANSNEDAYFAFLLRPTLDDASEQPARVYAFTIDTSRSMFGEGLRRAKELATRMIRELSASDQVLVLACDSSCRSWSRGRVPGGAEAAEQAKQWLDTQTAEGASDLVASFEAAVAELRGAKAVSRQVVYIGDGTPTVGPTRPNTITQAVQKLAGASDVTLTAVAVGAEADLDSLRALARGIDGVVVPYVPGTSVARASYAALAATYATRLADVRLELPPGLTAVAPERIDTLVSGQELLVVGRAQDATLRGDLVLRGMLRSGPFEQRFSVDARAVAGDANAFVPRLYAGLRMAELELRGDPAAKAEAIELSRRFSVASRYTSLLVLESQAMVNAFGLDNRRRAETWSGELEDSATASGADAETKDESASEDGAEGAALAAPMSAAKASAASGGNLRDNAAGAEQAGPAGFAERKRAAPAAAMPAAAPKQAEADEAWAAPPPPLPQPAEAWEPLRPTPQPRRRMIPMRRIWERKGEVQPGQEPSVSDAQLSAAMREASEYPDRRSATKRVFDLYAKRGDLQRASEIAERWSERDPLDVEALIARADVAARTGQRAAAIRILGSVVDVRPSDIGAQQRLARLFRWQGDSKLACRFSLALAEFRPTDERALADALRCLRVEGSRELETLLRATAVEKTLRAADTLLERPLPEDALSGDLRVTATWDSRDGDVDVDLSLIDPDGHHVSWLGAPTRAVITATHPTSTREEGLAMRGAKPGQYVLEVTRGQGAGRAEGTAMIRVAGVERSIRFSLAGDRSLLGLAKITTVPRLVPFTDTSMIKAAVGVP